MCTPLWTSTYTQYRWYHPVYSHQHLYCIYITIQCGQDTWRQMEALAAPTQKYNRTELLHLSCYLYLFFLMYVVDNSSDLNVMQNTLWNGLGCINTISWESWPPGKVNVLILQSRAVIKLFHEFQWDSFTRPLRKEQKYNHRHAEYVIVFIACRMHFSWIYGWGRGCMGLRGWDACQRCH